MPISTVARKDFDGSCVSVTIGLSEMPVIKSTYGDNVKAEWVRELGSMIPTADTPGIYETTEGTITMRSAVARESLFPYLPQFGAAAADTVATIVYTHPDIGTDSDQLVGFRVMGAKTSLEAAAKGLEVELTIRYRKVLWTDKAVCFGNENGGFASGELAL